MTTWSSTSARPRPPCRPCWPNSICSNLDDNPTLAGHNTTTEFMAGEIFEAHAAGDCGGRLGAGAAGLCRMRVQLSESHIAWAGYEAAL